ncbi:hypothetical protein BGZ98_000065 [Dissophora globulifera]|nr:hypothetical protein BGZ98_000065 [Dissophora globulifera]
MSDNKSTPPTPYSQFCLFKNLSYSLFEDDWINMIESWQAMVTVNAPVAELSFNLTPFFANAPRLLPVFHRYMTFAEQNPEFLSTLTTVLLSTPLLIKVQQILQSTELFAGYIVALKLDDSSASHTQVMQSLQTFLSGIPDDKRLEIQRIFAEEEASDSMGLSTNALDTALQLLHADTQLYIDILSTLQLNQVENMPWDQVVKQIKGLVLAKKPQAWSGIDQFLQSLHWAPQHVGSASNDMDTEVEDDHVLEMIEGIDYYPDEDEETVLGAFPEGEEYDQHYAEFLQGVQDIQAGPSFVNDFAKMGVAVGHQAVESC